MTFIAFEGGFWRNRKGRFISKKTVTREFRRRALLGIRRRRERLEKPATLKVTVLVSIDTGGTGHKMFVESFVTEIILKKDLDKEKLRMIDDAKQAVFRELGDRDFTLRVGVETEETTDDIKIIEKLIRWRSAKGNRWRERRF